MRGEQEEAREKDEEEWRVERERERERKAGEACQESRQGEISAKYCL